MGPIGMQEMIFILILALLLFGPKKLPELARLLGKGMSEFRRAKNELKNTFDTHMQELERETRLEEARKNPPMTPTYTPYSYTTDEYGHQPNGYGYNGSTTASEPYPAEPAVDAHATVETPALPPVPAVPGTVPRSTDERPA